MPRICWIITIICSTFSRTIIYRRVLEIIKNLTLTNNKKEIDVTKNGKNFLAPRVQGPRVQSSRVQAFRSPEFKRSVVPSPRVQSPSVQSSKVQVSCCPESKSPGSKSPESKRPDHTLRVQLFRYAFLNIVIQTSMLFIAKGFVTMFCKNVETSLSCLFIQLTN